MALYCSRHTLRPPPASYDQHSCPHTLTHALIDATTDDTLGASGLFLRSFSSVCLTAPVGWVTSRPRSIRLAGPPSGPALGVRARRDDTSYEQVYWYAHITIIALQGDDKGWSTLCDSLTECRKTSSSVQTALVLRVLQAGSNGNGVGRLWLSKRSIFKPSLITARPGLSQQRMQAHAAKCVIAPLTS